MNSPLSHPYSPKKNPLGGLQPALAWTAILGLVLFSALCTVAGAGSLLRLLFPGAAVAVGALLYLRYPVLYVGFTWWLWFLTPFLRRLVDYRSGWQDPSIMLLAPPLVTLITLASFGRHLPRLCYRDGLPFVLCWVSVVYALLIGLIRNSPAGAVLGFLNWSTPILFGCYLFMQWQDYPAYRKNMQRVFLWGILVMGAYGVVQFLIAPDWDRFWLINTDVVSFGLPEPFGIRLFSTMNSPQPFGGYMMAGLLLLFSASGPLMFLAAGVGYLAFLLSLARSAWLGWVVGLLVLIPLFKPRMQMRLVLSILIMAILVVPLVNLPPFSDVIQARLQSLSNTQEDSSITARTEGYSAILGLALSEGIGRGLGFVLESDSLGANDSGVLALMFSLGWLGVLPHIGGLILILFQIFQTSQKVSDPFASTVRAAIVGIISQIGLNAIMVGVFGVLLWGLLGIGLAASKYHLHSRTDYGPLDVDVG